MLLATDRVHLDIPNADGEPLLFWAVKANDGAVVESLLATGKVDVDQTDSHGMTPLLLAERDERTAIADLLRAHQQGKCTAPFHNRLDAEHSARLGVLQV